MAKWLFLGGNDKTFFQIKLVWKKVEECTQKICVVSYFLLPQSSNISTHKYLPYLWHFAILQATWPELTQRMCDKWKYCNLGPLPPSLSLTFFSLSKNFVRNHLDVRWTFGKFGAQSIKHDNVLSEKLISQPWGVQKSPFLEEMTLTHYILMSVIFRSHLTPPICLYILALCGSPI